MLDLIEALYREKGHALSIGFSGAGGKTTSLFLIAEMLIKNHQKVLITTTTKMFLEEKRINIPIVIRETFRENDLKQIDSCRWFAGESSEGKGLAPDKAAIESVNKYTEIWKLIEIDGAKHHPIKAPRADEPVYVAGLDLVFGVIGASVVGKPATEAWVHRLDLFLEVTEIERGEIITPEVIRRLIISPNGLFKDLPAETKPCVLITQVRTSDLEWIQALKAAIAYPIEVIPWQHALKSKA